jgi:hypothetical protein
LCAIRSWSSRVEAGSAGLSRRNGLCNMERAKPADPPNQRDASPQKSRKSRGDELIAG